MNQKGNNDHFSSAKKTGSLKNIRKRVNLRFGRTSSPSLRTPFACMVTPISSFPLPTSYPRCLNDGYHNPLFCCRYGCTSINNHEPRGCMDCCRVKLVTSTIPQFHSISTAISHGQNEVTFDSKQITEQVISLLFGMGYQILGTKNDKSVVVRWYMGPDAPSTSLFTEIEKIINGTNAGSKYFSPELKKNLDLSKLGTKFPNHSFTFVGDYLSWSECGSDVTQIENFFISAVTMALRDGSSVDIGQLIFTKVPSYIPLVLEDHFVGYRFSSTGDHPLTLTWTNNTPGAIHTPFTVNLAQKIKKETEHGMILLPSPTDAVMVKWLDYATKKYPTYYFEVERTEPAFISWVKKSPEQEEAIIKEIHSSLTTKTSISTSYLPKPFEEAIQKQFPDYEFKVRRGARGSSQSKEWSPWYVVSWSLRKIESSSEEDPIITLSNHIGLDTTLGPAFLRKAGVTPENVELAMNFIGKVPTSVIRDLLSKMVEGLPDPWNVWGRILIGTSTIPDALKEMITGDLVKVLENIPGIS